MSYEVRVVCRPEVAPGFGLAGLHTIEADSGTGAGEILGRLASQTGVGVILMQDTLFESLPDDIRRRFGRVPLPMIVPFPGPERAAGRDAGASYIIELLRQVVGYRVRFR